MIVYAQYRVQFHGLMLRNMAEVKQLQVALEHAAKLLHPDLRFESDVDVELDETAGQEEP